MFWQKKFFTCSKIKFFAIFMIFVSRNNGRTTKIFFPPLLFLLLDPGSGINFPDPQHCFLFWLRITSFFRVYIKSIFSFSRLGSIVFEIVKFWVCTIMVGNASYLCTKVAESLVPTVPTAVFFVYHTYERLSEICLSKPVTTTERSLQWLLI